MKILSYAAALTAMVALSPFASAHFDAIPYLDGNTIRFNGVDDLTGETASNVRVFGYDFGENVEDPYNIGDPGFNTQGASAFTAGSTLRLAGTGTLQYWDGTGEVHFTSAPTDVTLALASSPTRAMTFSSSSVTYTPAGAATLTVGTFASNGGLHVHLGSSIFSDGDQLPDSVAQGIYAIQVIATTSIGQVGDPIWIVFNNGLSEEQHDAAMGAIESTLVPEPAALTTLAVGSLALLARRRR